MVFKMKLNFKQLLQIIYTLSIVQSVALNQAPILACHIALDVELADVPPSLELCSHVILSSPNPLFLPQSSSLHEWNREKFTLELVREKAPDAHLIFSLRMGSVNSLYEVFKGPSSLASLLSFFKDYDLTSFDIAWELVQSTSEYSRLLHVLRAQLTRAGFGLTSTLGKGIRDASFTHVKHILPLIDYLFLVPMGNRFYNSEFHIDSAYLGENEEQFFDWAELNYDKIVTGVSMHSVEWKLDLVDGVAWNVTSIETRPYFEVCNASEFTHQKVDNLFVKHSDRGKIVLDPPSLSKRIKLFMEHGFAGVALYDYDMDDHEGRCGNVKSPLTLEASESLRSRVSSSTSSLTRDTELCIPFLGLRAGCNAEPPPEINPSGSASFSYTTPGTFDEDLSRVPSADPAIYVQHTVRTRRSADDIDLKTPVTDATTVSQNVGEVVEFMSDGSETTEGSGGKDGFKIESSLLPDTFSILETSSSAPIEESLEETTTSPMEESQRTSVQVFSVSTEQNLSIESQQSDPDEILSSVSIELLDDVSTERVTSEDESSSSGISTVSTFHSSSELTQSATKLELEMTETSDTHDEEIRTTTEAKEDIATEYQSTMFSTFSEVSGSLEIVSTFIPSGDSTAPSVPGNDQQSSATSPEILTESTSATDIPSDFVAPSDAHNQGYSTEDSTEDVAINITSTQFYSESANFEILTTTSFAPKSESHILTTSTEAVTDSTSTITVSSEFVTLSEALNQGDFTSIIISSTEDGATEISHSSTLSTENDDLEVATIAPFTAPESDLHFSTTSPEILTDSTNDEISSGSDAYNEGDFSTAKFSPTEDDGTTKLVHSSTFASESADFEFLTIKSSTLESAPHILTTASELLNDSTTSEFPASSSAQYLGDFTSATVSPSVTDIGEVTSYSQGYSHLPTNTNEDISSLSIETEISNGQSVSTKSYTTEAHSYSTDDYATTTEDYTSSSMRDDISSTNILSSSFNEESTSHLLSTEGVHSSIFSNAPLSYSSPSIFIHSVESSTYTSGNTAENEIASSKPIERYTSDITEWLVSTSSSQLSNTELINDASETPTFGREIHSTPTATELIEEVLSTTTSSSSSTSEAIEDNTNLPAFPVNGASEKGSLQQSVSLSVGNASNSVIIQVNVNAPPNSSSSGRPWLDSIVHYVTGNDSSSSPDPCSFAKGSLLLKLLLCPGALTSTVKDIVKEVLPEVVASFGKPFKQPELSPNETNTSTTSVYYTYNNENELDEKINATIEEDAIINNTATKFSDIVTPTSKPQFTGQTSQPSIDWTSWFMQTGEIHTSTARSTTSSTKAPVTKSSRFPEFSTNKHFSTTFLKFESFKSNDTIQTFDGILNANSTPSVDPIIAGYAAVTKFWDAIRFSTAAPATKSQSSTFPQFSTILNVGTTSSKFDSYSIKPNVTTQTSDELTSTAPSIIASVTSESAKVTNIWKYRPDPKLMRKSDLPVERIRFIGRTWRTIAPPVSNSQLFRASRFKFPTL